MSHISLSTMETIAYGTTYQGWENQEYNVINEKRAMVSINAKNDCQTLKCLNDKQ